MGCDGSAGLWVSGRLVSPASSRRPLPEPEGRDGGWRAFVGGGALLGGGGHDVVPVALVHLVQDVVRAAFRVVAQPVAGDYGAGVCGRAELVRPVGFAGFSSRSIGGVSAYWLASCGMVASGAGAGFCADFATLETVFLGLPGIGRWAVRRKLAETGRPLRGVFRTTGGSIDCAHSAGNLLLTVEGIPSRQAWTVSRARVWGTGSRKRRQSVKIGRVRGEVPGAGLRPLPAGRRK